MSGPLDKLRIRFAMTARAPAIAALAFLGLLIGGALLGLGVEALRNPEGAWNAFDPYLLRLVRFTLWQALLSTLLSILPALLVAHAFSRHPSFPGRQFLLWLFAVPLSLPAIVATLGLLMLLGRSGLLAGPLSALANSEWPGIYGLGGILVAHVFFNLPLATRLFLLALDGVPADQWRLASQLGMDAAPSFRFIEWPAMRRALPGIAGLVFMLCVTSFTIVLTLGGGPRATTLEVAIYQALRFDFDPARAVALTLVQVALTVAVVALMSGLGASSAVDGNLSVSPRRPPAVGWWERLVNVAAILCAAVLVAGPLSAIVFGGLQADLGRLVAEAEVRQATATSLALASGSAALATALSWSLAAGRRNVGQGGLLIWLMESGAGFVLVVPPIVIGSGWFMLLRGSVDVLALAPVMVVTVNAAMAMPFVLRTIRPAYDASAERHDRLAAQLGIRGWNRLRLIDWPAMRRSVLVAFAFAMALSLGDLGVIALFGSDNVQTLPYLLYARMGSYRTADAAGLALFLGIVCFSLSLLADLMGRRKSE